MGERKKGRKEERDRQRGEEDGELGEREKKKDVETVEMIYADYCLV